MDFKDSIKQIPERIEKLKDSLPTEEATKNALILPFIGALGYDVFNPLEVLPEMTCDIGTKKGEKIDYAIFKDGKPVILIECKHWSQDLNLHDNQLLRYFTVSRARFGVLTNGIVYRFYTDLVESNIMDERPFLEVNMLDLKDNQIEELKKFHKSYFDVDSILSSASDLKNTTEIKSVISQELTNPSVDFVRFLCRKIDLPGQITSRVIDQFTPIVKKAIGSYINDIINDLLKTAMETDSSKDVSDHSKEPEQEDHQPADDGIVTTQEEIDGYNIVRGILAKEVDIARITCKDYKTYFVVSIDDCRWKWICRFYFGTYLYIAFPKENGEEKVEIQSINDIFNFSDKLLLALNDRIGKECQQ